jgi:ferritin-like metal-binding protein YciE
MSSSNRARMTTDELLKFGKSVLKERALDQSTPRRSDAPLRSALVAPESSMSAGAPRERTLEDLFYDTMKDIYFAERQILRALPKMARAAQSPELKAGFEKHREETEGQVERLQQVFELIGKRAQGKTCEAIQGILAEGEEIMEEFKGTSALDAGLISAAQAVEHYEIARYGTLKTWALQLGLPAAAELFTRTLAEENQMDRLLTEIASAPANVSANRSVA